MTREGGKMEECIGISRSILQNQKRFIQGLIKEGDPGLRPPEKVTLKNLGTALKEYGIPNEQIKSLTGSSESRRQYIRKYDVSKWGDMAGLIGRGADVKEKMKEAMQSGAGGSSDETVQSQAAILAYEAFDSKLSQYALMNAIFGTNITSNTQVVYGGEKMTYWAAQQKQINTYVEDNIGLLKKVCEDSLSTKI